MNILFSGFAFNVSLSGYSSGPGKVSLIISLFLMFALIELYKKKRDPELLNNIISFYNLIQNKLPKVEDENEINYSYHFDRFDETYNATAKIGKFYALLYGIDPNPLYLTKIKKILNFLFRHQRLDGSWPYSKTLSYSDGFHTAFMIDSI